MFFMASDLTVTDNITYRIQRSPLLMQELTRFYRTLPKLLLVIMTIAEDAFNIKSI
ncbi:hypothetical protein NO976_04335 (plasmid) [Planktothrix agardhii]|jgi:hypothetical protein|nr:hypothetical protein NO976_04335 [Planktothrix agardhii]CAD5983977.1 hypothetical protein PCC7805_04429 [Planktothrix agardhii]